jgi:hypothetical protein
VGVGIAQFGVYNRQAGIMKVQAQISGQQLTDSETAAKTNFEQAKTAVQAAVDGAKAATRQAMIAEDTEQRQLRAYVGVEDHKLSNVGSGQRPHWEITIKNFGQTPATGVSYRVASVIDYSQSPTKLSEKPFEGSGILFPGDRMTPTNDVTNPLTPVDMTGISSGNTLFHVYGQVKYRDAFGERRCTKFRLMFGGEISMGPQPPTPGHRHRGQ